MYEIEFTTRFQKDLKRCVKRGLPLEELYNVLKLLKETGSLPPQYHPHKLSGKLAGTWECHIKSDWLLLWEQYDDKLLLIMTGTGTHADFYDHK